MEVMSLLLHNYLWPVKNNILLIDTDIAGLVLVFREGLPLIFWVRTWGRHTLQIQASHTIGYLYEVKRCFMALCELQPSAIMPYDSCPKNVKTPVHIFWRSERVTLFYLLSAVCHDNLESLNSLPPIWYLPLSVLFNGPNLMPFQKV